MPRECGASRRSRLFIVKQLIIVVRQYSINIRCERPDS
jgi:hypothetical protein